MTIQDVSVLKALQLNKASADRQAKRHDIEQVCAALKKRLRLRFAKMIVFDFVLKERGRTSFSDERTGFTSTAAEPRSI